MTNLFELPVFERLRKQFSLLPVLTDEELLKKYKCLDWYNRLWYNDPNNVGKNYYKFILSLDRQKLKCEELEFIDFSYIGYDIYKETMSDVEFRFSLQYEIEECQKQKEPYCIFKANSLEEAIKLFNQKILRK